MQPNPIYGQFDTSATSANGHHNEPWAKRTLPARRARTDCIKDASAQCPLAPGMPTLFRTATP